MAENNIKTKFRVSYFIDDKEWYDDFEDLELALMRFKDLVSNDKRALIFNYL